MRLRAEVLDFTLSVGCPYGRYHGVAQPGLDGLEVCDAGCGLQAADPVTELRSRCFCGAGIGLSCEEHVYDRHMAV